MELFELILAWGQISHDVHPEWGTVIKVCLPDGSGAWWSANGQFIGFLGSEIPESNLLWREAYDAAKSASQHQDRIH
jgi:hypothetical protein